MGAHWQWLGYGGADALVAEAGNGVAGQVDLMAISVSQIVGLGLVLIDGEFEFEVVFAVSQIDQCEGLKIQSFRYPQCESEFIEVDECCSSSTRIIE